MPICKSCGAEIIWAKSLHGKNMPLDAKKEKRFIVELQANRILGCRFVDTYTSHFATCPNAKQHRGKITDNPPPQGEKEEK